MKQTNMPTWEELEQKIGRKLSSFNELRDSGLVTMDITTFNKMLADNETWLSEMCYQVGKDVLPKKNVNRISYAIDGGKLIDFLNKNKTIPEIAKMGKINSLMIRRYIERGFYGDIASYRYGDKGLLYSVETVLKGFDAALNQSFEKYKQLVSEQEFPYGNFLPEQLITLIDKYIKHRLSKIPGISIGEILFFKKQFVRKEVAERHSLLLKSIFFTIICSLQGKELSPKLKTAIRMRNLSKDDLIYISDIDKNVFSLEDFDESIIQILADNYTDFTLTAYVNDYLRPFFYYFLMQKEIEMRAAKRKPINTFEQRYILSEDFDLLKTSIIGIFNKFSTKNEEPDEKKKSFLTREQYVKLYKKIWEKYGIQKALALELAFRVGLRAMESSLVAVEDFLIDANGLLILDKHGYGRLFLPAPKCKGGNDGGAAKRGILLPPATVNLINLYLMDLYEKCPFEEHKKEAGKTFTANNVTKVYENGHGYLLRDFKFARKVDSHISKYEMGKFLRKIRSECSFLNQDQRTFLKYHDGRHSLGEWIETAIVDRDLQPYLDFVADFQMHHTPSKSIRKKYYRDKDILEIYAKILDDSINFPLNLTELRQWEIERSYRRQDENEIEVDINTTLAIDFENIIAKNQNQKRIIVQNGTEKDKLLLQLQKINDQLAETIQRPKSMKVMEWTLLRVKLQEQKEKIEQKLHI